MLEDSLSALIHHPIRTVAAGRTDRGVHAWGQVVHFDAPSDPEWIAARLNKWLGPEIFIRVAAIVPFDFDARFSARRRRYDYRFYVAAARDPFANQFSVWLDQMPDVRAMQLAATALIGEHDFTSFCRAGQRSLQRNVRSIAFRPRRERLTITTEADSFCHQMVRSIVGTLLLVGRGERPESFVGDALHAKDRHAAGPVAPAHGLHLMKVTYRPDPFSNRPRA